jgi:hypothetical protein
MEHILQITVYFVGGIVIGGLFTAALFIRNKNLFKLYAWMGVHCNPVERAAIRRVMMTPGNHSHEDIVILTIVIQRAPEGIQQLLRQAARDVTRLEGE